MAVLAGCVLIGVGGARPLAAAEGDETALSPVGGVGREAASYRLQTRPQRIVLGKTKKVTFLVEAREPAGPLRPLRASVNVGTLLGIKRLKAGRYSVSYRPPKKHFPQVAILALWRETGIDASVAFFRIPLLGSARIPIDAAPGATVVADVGGVQSRPVVADKTGKVQLRLVVPPGVPVAKLLMTAPGQPDRAGTYPLQVPPFNRMTVAVVPHAVPADGKSQARLLIFYDSFGGKVLDAAGLRLTATTGRLGRVTGKQNLLSAVWTAPPRGAKATEVNFVAAAKPDPASRAKARITLGPPAPAKVMVEASPARILGDGQDEIEVLVHVLDGEGLGVPGLKVKVRAELPGRGGAAQELTALGGGKYRFKISPILLTPTERPNRVSTAKLTVQAGDVVGEARVRVEPWVPVRLEVVPERLGLVADGRTRAVLRMRVLDAKDRPMPGQEVQVEASHGTLDETPARTPDGSLTLGYSPPKIEQTSIGGATEVGAVEGTVTVRVGGLEQIVPLILTPENRVVGGAKNYLEVAGGYGTNLGALLGPRLRLAGGTRLLTAGRFLLEAGLSLAGAQSSSQLAWSAGRGGSEGWLRAWEAWGQGELRAALVGGLWRLEVVAAGGVGYLRSQAAWGGSDPTTYSGFAPSVEGRLGFGLSLGPGRVALSVGYARRLHSAASAPPTFGVNLAGSVGGLFGTLGYRLEM